MTESAVEQRDGMRWLIVKDWTAVTAAVASSGRIDGIELNSSKGKWPGGLAFLRDVPRLRHLILVDLQERDVSVIEELVDLESLKLSAYATTAFDFAKLPRLRKAFVEWRKQYRNISACTELAELYLNGYSEASLENLRPLHKVQKLSIGDSRTFSSLQGIDGMGNLQYLGLFGLPHLRDLSPLQAVSLSLRELNLKHCRQLESLAPLAKVEALRRLILADCGEIPSLVPLADLRFLDELFFFGETNVIDGNLDFLKSRRLKSIAFKNRRHYSLRREDLTSVR